MRMLYIVGGVHTYNECTTREYNSVSDIMDIQDRFIARTAQQERCTGYFHDCQSNEDASTNNHFLEELVNRSEHERKGIIRKIRADEQKEKEHVYFNQIPYFLQLKLSGLPITYLPTEDCFNHIAYLKSKLPQHKKALEKLEKKLDCNTAEENKWDALYLIPLARELFVEKRDSEIFQNILEYGHEKNILFIGGLHKLQKFDTHKHDFKVYRINFDCNQGNFSVQGTLPERLRKVVDECCSFAAKKGYILNDAIQYVR